MGVFLAQGNGTFSQQTIYSTGIHSQPCAITVEDFNGDSSLDIAVANHGTKNIGIGFDR